MKIIFKYISTALLLGGLGLFTSCGNEFLNLEPQSTLTPEAYFSTDAQLRTYLMPLYESIEEHGSGGMVGIFGKDSGIKDDSYGTDNQVYIDINQRFVEGLWQVNSTTTSYWNFDLLYDVNYFLKNAIAKYEAGKISGNESSIKHCIGEGYWFRAYYHFLKLRDLGDFPIVDEVYSDSQEVLTKASKRSPRNEVARFILSDLDKAAEYMQSTAPGANGTLLSKNVAYLLKSRVALLEASWLENFKGTAFVPGGEGWPGSSKDYNSDFGYESGSIDAEIKYFLNEAIESADIVASSTALTPNNGVTPQGVGETNPYFQMFSDVDLSGYEEVLLWRAYNPNFGIWKYSHGVNYFLSKSNSCTGLTRGLVMQFLDRKGLPWYASEDFTNDEDLFIARLGNGGAEGMDSKESLRDLRISLFLKVPGQVNIWINRDQVSKGSKDEPAAPLLAHTDPDRSITGYLTRKGLNPDGTHNAGNAKSFTGCPIFRASEAYLNYIEAYYMLNKNLGGNVITYWEALRQRAGIEAGTIQNTIDALDISKEAKYDWAAYTAGQLISDKTQFAIRKERRSEFMCEGYRSDDLRRWRAMDQLISTPYQPQGFKLWGDVNWALYKDKKEATDYNNNLTSKEVLIQYPDAKAVISSRGDMTNVYPEDGDYIYPYRVSQKLNGFNGMIWKMAHYLVPLEVKDFTLTSTTPGDISTSPIYQNPYWPTEAGGTAIQ